MNKVDPTFEAIADTKIAWEMVCRDGGASNCTEKTFETWIRSRRRLCMLVPTTTEGLIERLRYLLGDAEFVDDEGTEWLAVMLTTLRAAESLFPQYGAPTSLLAEQKVNDAPWLNQNEKTSHTRH
jgi:hypothetical protein